MGFPRQEYWSELPFPPPGDLPDPGIEPTSPTLQTDSIPLDHEIFAQAKDGFQRLVKSIGNTLEYILKSHLTLG